MRVQPRAVLEHEPHELQIFVHDRDVQRNLALVQAGALGHARARLVRRVHQRRPEPLDEVLGHLHALGRVEKHSQVKHVLAHGASREDVRRAPAHGARRLHRRILVVRAATGRRGPDFLDVLQRALGDGVPGRARRVEHARLLGDRILGADDVVRHRACRTCGFASERPRMFRHPLERRTARAVDRSIPERSASARWVASEADELRRAARGRVRRASGTGSLEFPNEINAKPRLLAVSRGRMGHLRGRHRIRRC